MELGISAFAMGIVGGILVPVWIGIGADRKKRARLYTHGLFAPARIDGVRAREDDEDKSRTVTLDLTVMPEERPPYPANVSLDFLDEVPEGLVEGAMVLARIHPEDPSIVEIERG
jgi:hypothetical protein